MRVMAQVGMVMNLDKCIGCHTCSVTCKQAWTNRAGMEYAWFNNVETRPGQGYPRTYQDQEKWQGAGYAPNGQADAALGWRFKRLVRIFSNPRLPELSDYYEPWTYDYDMLISAPLAITPSYPAEVADLGQADEDLLVGQLGRRPRRWSGAGPRRSDPGEDPRPGHDRVKMGSSRRL